MLTNTSIFRILGACFYYSPNSETINTLIPVLSDLPALADWNDLEKVTQLSASLSQYSPEQLSYDYSMLFEGQGEMPAPPWGSVYLDHENIVMGESTLAYRQFLAKNDLVSDTYLNEPEDQFGLMLMAIAALCEQTKIPAAVELLEQYLLPWAYRYLELVQNTALEHNFYVELASVAEQYLMTLQQEMNLVPAKLQLFR